MYNILLSLAIALAVGLPIALWLGVLAAIVPALIAAIIAYILLSRRTVMRLQVEMEALVPLLQGRQIDAARQKLIDLKRRYGPWQVLLSGQMDAQLGVIDYMQQRYDDALPRLEAGKWRNATILTFIGCVHWRKSDKAKAWASFEAAVKASPKELIVWVVYATLLYKADQREDALKVVGRGLAALPDNAVLKELQAVLANKRKVDTTRYPQTWYQFFPEDLVGQQLMRGRRDGATPVPGMPGVPGGPPPAPLNRKMRRERNK